MIGLLPAAGKSERIHGLPKYLLPVGDSYLLKMHVDAMKAAGCREVHIGTNPANDDLIFDYSDGAMQHIADNCGTMTQTVLSLRQYCKGEPVFFGMPDTYFESSDVYNQLAYHMGFENDVVVAVFKARPGQYRQGGMCRIVNQHIVEVVDKPDITDPGFIYIWGALAWKPLFWDCLTPDMPHVGYGLPVAIERGLKVRAAFCEGNFWDAGTPERYFEMIRATTCDPQSA